MQAAAAYKGTMIPALFQVDPRDNVATALRDLAAGEQALGVAIAQPVKRGHKVALTAIAAGEPVLKFGFPIGRATNEIAPGDHVHSHNLATALEDSGEYLYHPQAHPAAPRPEATFQGYRRADGRVGTRNEIWIIPTVGCVARTAQKIAERPRTATPVASTACTPSPIRSAARSSATISPARARVLAALAGHPNAGGVLIVGLGCESNQLKALLAEVDPDRQRPHARRAGGGRRNRGGAGAVEELVEQRRTGEARGLRRFPRWCSASSAAARTAFPASPPIRWSGG